MKVSKVEIHNFLSIENLEFEFTEGLHLFTGNNGAGKSTILQAVSVGLYNKSIRPEPWSRLGGPGGYTIKVYFTDTKGNEVMVINDKVTNRYEVYVNSELKTHQISKGLPMVSALLNVSYHEFTMLVFLTPTTITGILTGTDSSLISKFFNLSVLAEYEKTLTEERRVLNKLKRVLDTKLVDSASTATEEDVEALNVKLKQLLADSARINSTPEVLIELPKLKAELLEIQEKIVLLRQDIKYDKAQLTGLEMIKDVCPTCGSKFTSNDTHVNNILKLRATIKDNTSNLEQLSATEDTILKQTTKITEPTVSATTKINEEVRRVEAELVASTILASRGAVDTAKLLSEISDVEFKITALNATLRAIKSGDVHKQYLQTFVAVLNGHLGALTREFESSMVIIAKVDSKGLSFSILEDGIHKFSNVLSAGEKVIVGLLVLTAMFVTLRDTLGIEVNLLMLDEAVSAVSTENMPIVKSILSKLAADRCVVVTQHHEELPQDLFKYSHKVSKQGGLTTIT